jgi:hypothetical protein
MLRRGEPAFLEFVQNLFAEGICQLEFSFELKEG